MLKIKSRTFYRVSHWSNLQPQSYVMKVYCKQIVYNEWFKFFSKKIKKKIHCKFYNIFFNF